MNRRSFLGLLGLLGCKDELEDMNIKKSLWWLGGAGSSSGESEDEAAWVETYSTYTPVYTGFSADPVGTAYYKNYGGMVHLWITVSSHGTSNATTFTMSLPIASANTSNQFSVFAVYNDAGTAGTSPGRCAVLVNSTTLSISKGSNWTASGTKSASLSILYEASGYSAWVPAFTGFSANPTVTARYISPYANFVHCYINTTSNGTSNATTTTVTLPLATPNNGITQYIPCALIVNSGSTANDSGLVVIPPNSNIATIYRDATMATAWTASGAKSFNFSIQYEANV